MLLNLLSLLWSSTLLFAQVLPLQCEVHQPQDAAYQQKKIAQEQAYQEWIEAGAKRKHNDPYIIPLVFHIYHNYGKSYVQEIEVIEAIERLNLYFANLPPYYDTLGVSTNIQFCLASRTTEGFSTNGINYYDKYDFSINPSLDTDNFRYVNVDYKTIGDGFSFGGGILIGYQAFDEFIETFVHEMGHEFGLDHTFMNYPLGSCSNHDCLVDGDKVCDTPPHLQLNFPPCEEENNTCSTDVNLSDINNPFIEDQFDPNENHMSYGSCRTRFTQGQVERMWFFLENVYPELWDSEQECGSCPPIKTSFEEIPPYINYGDTLRIQNLTPENVNFHWYINDELVSTDKHLVYSVTGEGYSTIRLEAIPLDTTCATWSYRDQIHIYCSTDIDVWTDDLPIYSDSCINIEVEGEIEGIYVSNLLFNCEVHQPQDAAYQQKKIIQEQAYQKWIEAGAKRKHNDPYIIPLVFHIYHNYGKSYVQEIEVIEVVDYLNESFTNKNEYWDSLGINTNIQFCLASKDPNGKPSNGIIYQTEYTNISDFLDWDGKNYCNIRWIPNYPGGAAFLGINGERKIISMDRVMDGNIGIFTHEMGHILELAHTFTGTPLSPCPNTNCLVDGDKVCDTPPHLQLNFPPCEEENNTCSTDVNLSDINNPFIEDQFDPNENHMSYGSCRTRFTQGQVERMWFFLENVYPELWDSEQECGSCPPIKTSFEEIPPYINYGDTLRIQNLTPENVNFHWYINDELVSTDKHLVYSVTGEGYSTIRLEAIPLDTTCATWSYRDQIHIYCSTDIDVWTDDLPIYSDSCIYFQSDYTEEELILFYNSEPLSQSDTTICIEEESIISIVSSYGIAACPKEDTLVYPVINTADKQQFFGKIWIEPGNEHTLTDWAMINSIRQDVTGQLLLSGNEANRCVFNRIDSTYLRYGFIRMFNEQNPLLLQEYRIGASLNNLGIEITDAIAWHDDIYFIGLKRNDGTYYYHENTILLGKMHRSGRLIWSYEMDIEEHAFPSSIAYRLYHTPNGRFFFSALDNFVEFNKDGEIINNYPFGKVGYLNNQNSTSPNIQIEEPIILGNDIFFSGKVENVWFLGKYNIEEDVMQIHSNGLPNTPFKGILVGEHYYFIGMTSSTLAGFDGIKEILCVYKTTTDLKYGYLSKYIISDRYSNRIQRNLDIKAKPNGNLLIYVRNEDTPYGEQTGSVCIIEIDTDGQAITTHRMPSFFDRADCRSYQPDECLFQMNNGWVYLNQSKNANDRTTPVLHYSSLRDSFLLCSEYLDTLDYLIYGPSILNDFMEEIPIDRSLFIPTIQQEAFPLTIENATYIPFVDCDTSFRLPDYKVTINHISEKCNDYLGISFEICVDTIFSIDKTIRFSVFKGDPTQVNAQQLFYHLTSLEAGQNCTNKNISIQNFGSTTLYSLFINLQPTYPRPFDLDYRYFDAADELEHNYLNNYQYFYGIAPTELVLLEEDSLSICSSDTIELQVNSSYEEILWSTGETTSTIAINQGGLYSLMLTDTCGQIRIDTIMVFQEQLLANVEIEIFPSDSIQNSGSILIDCEDDDLQFSLNNSPWQKECFFENLAIGSYSLAIQHINGCQEDTLLIITLDTIVNVLDPTKEKQLFVSPNPSSTILRIQLEKEQINTIRLYTITGKLIVSQTIENDNTLLEVTQYNSGLYLLEVLSKSGNRYVERVIIQH